jgi:hypothetical protein
VARSTGGKPGGGSIAERLQARCFLQIRGSARSHAIASG